MSKGHGSNPTFEQWAGLPHHIVQERFVWAWTPDPKKRRVRQAIEYDDLVQQANLTLLNAIELWDKDRGVLFQTYAYCSIYNRLKEYVDSAIRSTEWRALRFSEIEARQGRIGKEKRDSVQILDPSQEAELYNVLHGDWVQSCMERIGECIGEEGLRLLVEHSGGRTFKDIAAEQGVSKEAIRRRYHNLIKSAYSAIKDQEELLE